MVARYLKVTRATTCAHTQNQRELVFCLIRFQSLVFNIPFKCIHKEVRRHLYRQVIICPFFALAHARCISTFKFYHIYCAGQRLMPVAFIIFDAKSQRGAEKNESAQ